MNTVVLVDNDSKWIANYKRMLAPFRENLNCMYFEHSEKAMEYITSHPVEVLVSELDMPLMSGKELFEMVDMLSPDTVKIAMTQVKNVADTLDVLNHSRIFKLILKPFFLVEDLVVPIQAGIMQYKSEKQERDFRQREEKELERLNQGVEEFWEKLGEKKEYYDRICRLAMNILAEDFSPQIAQLQQVESEFAREFCEKLLQEFVQYYMYEKRNFIYYMNYLKNQFHYAGRSCVFQISNETGGEIPPDVMKRIAYGMFLTGYWCQQCLENYEIENVIAIEGEYYALKIIYRPSAAEMDYKITSPRIQTLLLRIVEDLKRALSDAQDLRQGLLGTLYYRFENQEGAQ